MFTPGDLPAEALGLAYDAAGGVLWVGSTGVIAPFNLAGLRLGANVDTTMQLGGGASIDGLAFIASVPEPGTLALFGVGLIAVLAKRGRR